ncbi:YtxH domain-containing protein [Holophaga foetida]|uniref:YtxH domain-containing protein n=1 Tax=Holophaga foetida TaxID=35839 RepID=UPI0002472EDA|nr:YtxH domain-containing protein [Holophaga foetida]
MSEDRGSIGTSLVIFLAGAAVGAAVVALLNPKSGPELRADLRGLGEKVKDRVARFRGECCSGEAEHEAPGKGEPSHPYSGG